jgi:hypothetical protein
MPHSEKETQASPTLPHASSDTPKKQKKVKQEAVYFPLDERFKLLYDIRAAQRLLRKKEKKMSNNPKLGDTYWELAHYLESAAINAQKILNGDYIPCPL